MTGKISIDPTLMNHSLKRDSRFALLRRMVFPLIFGFVALLAVSASGQESGQPNLQDKASKKIDEVKKQVDESEEAKQVAESILNPIYQLAESFSFSSFYWIAFALMAAGVVSFALQLVIGKLFMLAKFHFSLTEILFDALAFLISLVGLVLTTQAATENSTFTESSFAVLSSAAVGLVVGVIMFFWGTKQEAQAADAQKALRRKPRSE